MFELLLIVYLFAKRGDLKHICEQLRKFFEKMKQMLKMKCEHTEQLFCKPSFSTKLRLKKNISEINPKTIKWIICKCFLF